MINKPSSFWALSKILAFCLYQLFCEYIRIQLQWGEKVTDKQSKVTCHSTTQPCSESTAWLLAPRSWHTWRAPALPDLGSSTPLLAYQHICQLVVGWLSVPIVIDKIPRTDSKKLAHWYYFDRVSVQIAVNGNHVKHYLSSYCRHNQ